jgi:hypothetical protein
MKLALLFLVSLSSLLVSCAQEPRTVVVHRYDHYREQPRTTVTRTVAAPAPTPQYTIPGNTTRLDENGNRIGN